jgi:uncharacterized delta-60 repeat protein
MSTRRFANALVSLLCSGIILAANLGVANATPGALDTTSFAPSGVRYPADTLRQSEARHLLAIGGDGAIYVAGECNTASSLAACVRKFRSDGTLDASYAASGYRNLAVDGYIFSSVAGIALTSRDGSLAVAGTCSNAATAESGSCIVRFDATGGTVQPAVNSGQLVLFSTLQTTVFTQLKSGGLTMAGYCAGTNATASEFCIHSWADFGTVSLAGGPFPDGYWSVAAILPRSNGGLWLINQCKNGAAFVVCLIKMTYPGSLDFSFGSGGVRKLVETISGTPELAAPTSALLQPDDKFLIAGRCRGTGLRPCLKRFNADGSVDTQWAVASATPNTLQFGNGNEALAINASRDALAIQADGKILYATTLASSPTNLPARSDIVVHRFNADGSLDASYGVGGAGRTRLNAWGSGVINSAASAIAVTHSDVAVTLGACASESVPGILQPCLAKLQGGPLNYARCSGDIDGDGLVTPVVDSLILTRIALGFTGNAVTQGVAFAPHAARKSWPLMREHLISQCGMALP